MAFLKINLNVLRIQDITGVLFLWSLPACYAHTVSSKCVEVTEALSGFFLMIIHAERTGDKLAMIASEIHN